MLKYIIILFLVGCSSEQLVFELPTLNDSSSKSVATKSSNTTQTTEALPETPLTLNVALAQARDNSPALRASRFRLEAQQQRLKVAGRLPNPEFAIKTEAQPLGSNASSTSTSDSGDTLIGFSQTVPLGGQAATARAIETEAFRALQLRHDGLALELESKVRGAFATALSLQQAALLQTQQLQRLNQLLDLRQALIDAGELIPSDDLELRVQHSNLGAELVQIRRNQRLAQDELTARMGLVQSPTLALLGDLNATLDLPHLNDLLDQLIDTPVVAEAFSQAQVAHLRAQLAKANRVPDINLELFYRQTADGQDAFDAAVLFQLPLNGRASSNSRAAKAEASASQQHAQLQLQESRIALAQSYAQLKQAQTALLRHQDDILAAVEQKTDVFELRYKLGEISLAEVLQQRNVFAQAKLQRLAAWRHFMLAWGRVRQQDRLLP